MPKPTLSDTACGVLRAASEHPERLAVQPVHLPTAAQRAVVRSLLKAGLLEEVEAKDGHPSWRRTDVGQVLPLRLTDTGLLAVGPCTAALSADAAGQTEAVPSAKLEPSRRETVRRSAQAITDAWDDSLDETHPALASAMATLRNALTTVQASRIITGVPR